MVPADVVNDGAQSFPVHNSRCIHIPWDSDDSLSMCCEDYGASGVLIKLLKLIDIFLQHGKMYTKLDCIQ